MFCIVSNLAYSQYVKYPVRYDAETTVHNITLGGLMNYLSDTIELEVEKNNGKFKVSIISSKKAYQKIEKVFGNNFLEIGGKTNGGYHFTINLLDEVDDVTLNRTILFKVKPSTQKINKVTIYKE